MKRSRRPLVLAALLVPLALAVAAFAVTFASCASVGVRGKATADAAILADAAAIWTFYDGKGPVPTVLIVEPSESTCTAPTGYPGFEGVIWTGDHFEKVCREGYTLLPDRVSVVRREDMRTSALRHELRHAAYERDGIVDPGHKRPEWRPGGQVDDARNVMKGPP